MSAYSAASTATRIRASLAALRESGGAPRGAVAAPISTTGSGRSWPSSAAFTGLDRGAADEHRRRAVETAIQGGAPLGLSVKGHRAADRAEIHRRDGNFHGAPPPSWLLVGAGLSRRFGSVRARLPARCRSATSPRWSARSRRRLRRMLVEPIQARPHRRAACRWLAGVRRLCDAHNCCSSSTEVQSVLGRHRPRFAFEHEHVRPDGPLQSQGARRRCAAGLGRSFGRRDLRTCSRPLDGSTFGQPARRPVGFEAIRVLDQEGLVER